MNYYIITGASRGLGEAIAEKLIDENNYLICISRRKNENLIRKAINSNCSLDYYEFDLNEITGVDLLFYKVFKRINISKAETLCLINNAGILHPIKSIANCESSEVIENMNINIIAPMILSSQFIKQVENIDCRKVIVNISSDAGKRPYYGWSCYCSAKAALDMFTRTVGEEQISTKNPIKIVSFAPGIINTEMQKYIRQSNIEDFKLVGRFIKYKEVGLLKEASFVADKVIRIVENCEIRTGSVLDISDI